MVAPAEMNPCRIAQGLVTVSRKSHFEALCPIGNRRSRTLVAGSVPESGFPPLLLRCSSGPGPLSWGGKVPLQNPLGDLSCNAVDIALAERSSGPNQPINPTRKIDCLGWPP